MKILYVEDNPNDAQLVQRALKNAEPSYAIEITNSINSALQVLDRSRDNIDVILTDLNLPDGSGTSLLTYVRANKLPQAVVVITGNNNEETIVSAMKAGADDYIVKNFDYLERLHLTISSAIQRRSNLIAMHSQPLSVLYAINDSNEISATLNEIATIAPHIQIVTIGSAEETMELLIDSRSEQKWDVVLTDYLLPGKNGLDLIKEIHESFRIDLPVILVTGNGNEDVLLQASRLGVADYVIKKTGYIYRLPMVIENAYFRSRLAREQAALQESEARFLRIAENAQDIIYRVEFFPRPIFRFVSPSIETITGYTPDELYNNFRLLLRMVHPADRKQVFSYIKNQSFDQPLVIRWKGKKGNVIWVEQRNAPQYDKQGDLIALDGIARDITKSKRAEEALQRRDAIMEAVSMAAEQFLKGNWEENINQVLARLGQAARVSRAYIFQNSLGGNGHVLVNMVHEWVADGIAVQITNPEMTGFDFQANGFAYWIPTMQEGKPVYGRVTDFSAEEKEVFKSQNILSLICVPIFVDQEWWGFFGFDDCKTERDWPSTEIDALKAAANTLGAAIQREKAQTALQKQLREITTVQKVTLAGTQATSVDELISLTTKAIHEMFEANDCGVLLYDPAQHVLKCHSSYVSVSKAVLEKGIRISEGITGKAFRTGKSVLSKDVRTNPDYLSTDLNTLSEVCVPIRINGKIIGVLNAESPELDAFDNTDLQLMVTISNQLATGIQKIQLFEIERSRRNEAETLRKAASALTMSLDIDQVLQMILISLKQVVPFDSASIFLVEQDKLRLTSVHGFPKPDEILGMTFPANDPLFLDIVASGQPLYVNDAWQEPRFGKWAGTDYVRSWMGVPLIVRGSITGYITLDSRQTGTYDDRIAAVTQAFAHQAAVSIENARLFAEVRHRLNELEVVNKISVGLRTAQTLEEMLPRMLVETLNVIHASVGAIWLYDSSCDELYQAAGRGWITRISHMRMKPGRGIIGMTFSTGEISVSPDFSGLLVKETGPLSNPENEPHRIEVKKNAPMEWGGACFPIHATDQIVGVLFVQPSNQLTKEEVRLLSTLTEMSGNAIHRATLHNRTRQQVQRLTALRDVDIAISSSFDLRVTLGIIIDHIIDQLKVDAASVLLFNPLMQSLDYASGRGFYSSDVGKTNLRLSDKDNYARRAALERKTIIIPDIRKSNIVTPRLVSEGIISYFGVPLIAKGQVKGVLEAFMRTELTPNSDWLEFLEAMGGQAAIAIDNSQLFTNLQRSNVELALAYDTTLEGWGRALELRDEETEGHTKRVADLTMRLASRLGIRGDGLVHIRRGVLLHDIGKMGVPDKILHKPGPLTEDEWVVMRGHTQNAYDLLSPIEFLQEAINIPYCHHEKWDGSGYPRGMKGEEIPQSARIFSVIDVWDALLSDRPYRKAWPKEKTIAYIRDRSGIEFDPKVVHEFLRMIEEENL